MSQRLNSANFTRLKCIDLSLNYKLKSLDFLKYFTKYKSLNKIYLSILRTETEFLTERSTLHSRKQDDFYGFKICCCRRVIYQCRNSGWIRNICIDELIKHKKKDKLDTLQGIKLLLLKLNLNDYLV